MALLDESHPLPLLLELLDLPLELTGRGMLQASPLLLLQLLLMGPAGELGWLRDPATASPCLAQHLGWHWSPQSHQQELGAPQPLPQPSLSPMHLTCRVSGSPGPLCMATYCSF